MKMVVIGNIQKGIPRTIKTQRWWLIPSLIEHNDCPKLDLPRAWEPPCKHCTLSLGKGKISQSFFSHGDKANSGQDEEDSTRLTI